jgi:acyl dehydratase
MRYWQDIKPGETFTTARLTVSEADILEFAAEFDPQPYHLDRGAAQESIFGGLCASGWQVTAMMMRLLIDTLQEHQIAALGSSGVNQLHWKKPVFAGDELSAQVVIKQCHDSGQPGFGSIECQIEVNNQDHKSVISTTISMLVQLAEAIDQPGGVAHG